MGSTGATHIMLHPGSGPRCAKTDARTASEFMTSRSEPSQRHVAVVSSSELDRGKAQPGRQQNANHDPLPPNHIERRHS